MKRSGNDTELWGEMMWTAIRIVGAFLAAMIAVGVTLLGFGVGWL
ncbi:hypothetical protein [Mesorhizobium sp. B2-5-9]|nr:hypothetical protein [Mesorhizobium sp. B2-5-9]